MNRPPDVLKPAHALMRLPALRLALAILLLAGLLVVPAAQATITNTYASAFDLTPALTVAPFTFNDAATDVSAFTRDAVEVDGLSACGNYPAAPANTYSVWYSFTPAASGWLLLSTMNAATNYDTVIEVWKTALLPANSLACNDDAVAGNRRSELNLPVVGGTHYIIAIRRHGVSTMTAPKLAFDAAFSTVRELFVDQSTGNDANTGSQALPFRTIGKAESTLDATGGKITILDPGTYNEAVTISVPTVLDSAGAVTIAGLTLAATPVSAAGAVAASIVTVQPGGLVQEGVDLVEDDGVVRLADGVFSETVTIDRNMTLQAINEGQATISPPSGAAVTLNGGTVTVTGLNLQADTGVFVSNGSGHVITRNNIFGNISGVGVENFSAESVDATRNWWGDVGGPPSDGDNVVGNVVYRPWCDSALPLCTNAIGAATQLVFTGSPGNTRAGLAFAAQPVVAAIDDLGNVDAAFTGNVTLAIKPGTGTPGATLGGTLSIAATAGVADFTGQGLNINYAGQGYQLAATSGALDSTASGDSTAFAITADRLVVTASPANPTAAGAPLAVTVAAQDGFGHTDATFAGEIALAIQTNPTGASLLGTASKTAASGVALFGGAGDAAILKAGTGYTLRASSTSLATGDSAAFDISSGAPAQLVFSVSPSNANAGVAFPTQPVVEVHDAAGNLITSYSGNVTLAIGNNPAAGTLSGSVTVAVSGGVATFTGLSIDKAGAGYTLLASSGALSTGTSAAFNIAAGPATALVYAAAPGNTRAGVAFLNQPVIEARDTYGNVATSFSGAVTLVIKPGTGAPGAALAGTATVNAVNGVAAFSGLSINKIGTAYKLTASASGLPSVDSSSFDITASGLAFTLEPVDTVAGQSLLVIVAAQDSLGNTDTNFNGPVTLVLKNTGPRGNPAVLFGNTTVTAVNGLANFSAAGLNIQLAGGGYILTASASGLANDDSAAFAILPGAATQLVVVTSPVNTPADATFGLEIEAHDGFGNLDTTFTSTVTLAIQANPGGGTLGGTLAKAAGSGYVSFAAAEGLNINKVGVGYTLRASSGGLAPGDTQAFNITANRLVFAVSPAATAVSAPLQPPPVVHAVDSFGNVDTTFNGNVALTIKAGTGTAGANLTGVAVRPALAGVATLSGLAISRVGAAYQLDATTTGLAAASSAAFDIVDALTYVPMAVEPPHADLIGSFKLSPAVVTPFEPTRITVTITNTGEAPAGQFWVDFYINPQNPPTGPNQPWDKSCGKYRCKYGIAWYVDQTLAPGASITLTSTRGSYLAKNTDWPGYFVNSKLDLYLYVDSWNTNIGYGAVYERNEANNRAELHLGGPSPAPAPGAAPEAALPDLPAR